MGSIFITYRKPGGYAQDDRWITVHPNGEEHEGRPVLIDDDGYVKGGMGGVWNGTKIHEAKSRFVGPRTPNKEDREGLKKVSNTIRNKTLRKKFKGVGVSATKKIFEELDNTSVYSVANSITRLKTKFAPVFEPEGSSLKISTHVGEKLKYIEGLGAIKTMTAGVCSVVYQWNGRPPKINLRDNTISFANDLFNNAKKVLGWQREMILRGYNMQVPESRLMEYTATHEFGHAIHNCLIAQDLEALGYLVDSSKNGWEQKHPYEIHLAMLETRYAREKMIAKYRNEIEAIAADIHKERGETGEYDVTKYLSAYGGSDDFEFFAECFASSQIGTSNILGEAMNKWLEKRMTALKKA